MSTRQDIGERLRRAREVAGLSQVQAAEFLHMRRPSISEAESGRRRVAAEELAELARLYSVSSDWLLYGRTEPHESLLAAAREARRLDPDDLRRLTEVINMLRSDE